MKIRYAGRNPSPPFEMDNLIEELSTTLERRRFHVFRRFANRYDSHGMIFIGDSETLLHTLWIKCAGKCRGVPEIECSQQNYHCRRTYIKDPIGCRPIHLGSIGFDFVRLSISPVIDLLAYARDDEDRCFGDEASKSICIAFFVLKSPHF